MPSSTDRNARAKEQGIPETFDTPADVIPGRIEDEIEQRARLFQLVERLPVDQRRVVGMRFAEEKSIREIAHEIGRSEGAVKQLQFRALQNLRAQLSDESGDTNG